MKRFLLLTVYFLPFTLFLSGCIFNKPQPEVIRPKVEEPVNTVPISERVYTALSFRKDSKYPPGKELVLTIAEGKKAETIEYEVDIQAGTSVQSSGGDILANEETAPYSRNVFLGSCSAGGACSYHKDVKGGTMLLRFIGSSIGNLRGEWSYREPGNDGKLSSRDGKFQLDAQKLKDSYAIISQTMGFPKPTGGDILAGPYHVASTASTSGDMSLTVHLSDESAKVTLLFWDGKAYKTMTSFVSGKTLTAKISSLGTYLVTN